jgi:hypothetical protein
MSFLRVGNIQNVGATKTATSDNITDVGNRNDIAYAQINKIAGQTMASGFDTILLDEILNNKNITISSNSIFFALPGVYSINIGFRFGSAGDAWTGVRLFNATTGAVGTSFGTGNVTNDPGPAMFNFFANIVNTSLGYSLQTYRAGATMAVATPDTSAGRAFVTTIVKVS